MLRKNETPCCARTRADLAAYLLILALGASAVLLHQRTSDFMGEDVFYADAAQSLLQHGSYVVNGARETTQPPGLAGILAALFAISGYSYATAVCAMAVFQTLGFLFFYELLRRRVPRIVAGGICVLLMTSPLYFAWATRMVYPCSAYFFTTMFALLAEDEYKHAATRPSTVVYGGLLTLSVLASLLIAVSTAALLAAMLALILFIAVKDPDLARTRSVRLLPVFLIGLVTLGLWMDRTAAPLDWSLPGYPDSYLRQLPLKSGNHPELGMAHWNDIPVRVLTNLSAESDVLAQLVLRHGVKQSKVAVVIVPILLMAIGWIYAVRRAEGKELIDWYFAGYQFIYLLWPWTMEPRYLLPIAPLACYYVWQGIDGLIYASEAKPRLVGSIGLPLALTLAIFATRWIQANSNGSHGSLPDVIVVALWLILAAGAACMAYTGQPLFVREFALGQSRISLRPELRYAGYTTVLGLILLGIAIDVRIAHENLSAKDFTASWQAGLSEALPQEVEAGLWLRAHTPQNSIIMARHWPTVRHYAERKLVWFAPISDPTALLQGIRRHAVDYVVVVKHITPYYLPDDDVCFERVQETFPASFQPVFDAGNVRIFRVHPPEGPYAVSRPKPVPF